MKHLRTASGHERVSASGVMYLCLGIQVLEWFSRAAYVFFASLDTRERDGRACTNRVRRKGWTDQRR